MKKRLGVQAEVHSTIKNSHAQNPLREYLFKNMNSTRNLSNEQ